MRKHILFSFSTLLMLTFISCANLQTNQQKGTAAGAGAGAAVGAILGQAIGGDTEATLIGAGIGAAIGGITGNQIGKYMDMQEQELQNAIAASQTASLQREENILRATFKGEAYFDNNSDMLKPGALLELQRIADVLNKYPQTMIEVGGHTDTRGSEEYNQGLSEKRAKSVETALIHNGVLQERLTTLGYGESRPISSDDALNRRVEILIIPIQKG